jgi:L-lactate dehydrogenase complex protein LldG
MFAARLRAADGRVTFAQPDLLDRALLAAVDADLPVVLTPDLSWLVRALQDQGITAVVGSRAAMAGGELEPNGVRGTGEDIARRGGRELEDVLRRAGTGVTGCLAAVASSGTIVVGTGGGNGGLIAALPPRHVAVLREADIRESLAETLAMVRGRTGRPGEEYVLVTGPSRTADIEMMSVVGVHGPVSLEVIVVSGEAA